MNHSKLTASSGTVSFQIIPAGSIRCNTVVLWHERSLDSVIVDPSDDARPAIAFARRLGLRVHHLLLTHGHFEHCADAERAAAEFCCPASLHPADHPLFFDLPAHARSFGHAISPRTLTPLELVDNQVFDVLPGCPIVVLHVPGHSEGSVAFFLPAVEWVCTGDTLFHNGTPRTDLPGGDASKLMDSVEHRLYSLAEETLVIPGHGPMTSIRDAKREQAGRSETRIAPTP